MARFLGRLVMVMLVMTALVRPVSEATLAHKLSALQVGVQKLAERGGAAIGLAAVVVATCVNLLSCEYSRELTDNVVLTAPEEVADSLPIMQGATTANETQIFILTEDSDDYLFSLLDAQGRVMPPATAEARGYPSSTHVMQRVLFQGLTAGTHYLLQVHSSASNALLDERELQTLNPARQDLRFAFTSCMLDYWPQHDIWEQMVMLDPDVIFLIGDNVYADFGKALATPADLWQRSIDTRNTINLFRNKKLIPVIATWDDHDYGMNNAGNEYPYKDEALTVFKTFFAGEETTNYQMPNIGVASRFSIYGYNFFLLDDRTFRTLNQAQPEAHFGSQQTQWLFSSLQGVEHAFIVSGDQFFGGYHPKDSFQGHHPTRFAEFLDNLMKLDGEVVFLSGDRHFSEIMRIPKERLGYETYEFTASPAHSLPRPFVFPNPLRIEGKDMTTNFMFVEVNEVGGGLRLRATSYTVGGEKLFSGEYTVARER